MLPVASHIVGTPYLTGPTGATEDGYRVHSTDPVSALVRLSPLGATAEPLFF